MVAGEVLVLTKARSSVARVYRFLRQMCELNFSYGGGAGCKVILGWLMNVLVINSGSSSIKFSVFTEDSGGPRSLFEGEVTGVGGAEANLKLRDGAGKDLQGPGGEVKAGTPEEAIHTVMDVVFGGQLPVIGAVKVSPKY